MSFRALFVAFSYVTAIVPASFLLPRLGLRRRTQWLLSALLFLIASRFALCALMYGRVFNPAWPVALSFAWTFLDSALLVFFFLQLPAYLFFRHLPLVGRRAVALILAVAAVSLAVVGILNCYRTPAVREVSLKFDGLPPEFDGYRIALLSDLHCSRLTPRSRFERIVRLTNAAEPDLVCITGDCMDGWVDVLGEKLEPLSGFVAPDGVMAVAGNHEYTWSWDEWRPFLEAQGICVLENSWTNIVRGSNFITVAGITDPYAARPRKRGANGRCAFDRESFYPYPDHAAAFSGAPTNSFRILLSHRPVGIPLADRAYGVKLQLSGHTHGGAYPGLGFFVGRCNDNHVRGLYSKGGIKLYVSPGIGQSASYPLRFFNPSEVTVITLRRKRLESI